MTPILLDMARKAGFTISREEPVLSEMLETFAKLIIEHEASKQLAASAIPEGWNLVKVIGFDELVSALDYADRKGFLPDYIKDSWEGFNWLVPAAPLPKENT